MFDDDLTLQQANQRLKHKVPPEFKLPFIIWLFEIPESPLSFSFAIGVKEHDYVHCVTNQPPTREGEAHVIGFTMGADDRCKEFHRKFFKFCSKYIYPGAYKFDDAQLAIFDAAFEKGRQSRTRNLNALDWAPLLDQKLADIRQMF